MKLFNDEIAKFHTKLINKENFALARFGDGEMMAMRGDTIASGYGEWNTNGPESAYSDARYALTTSFQGNTPGYYTGIVCPCCQGMDNFNKMRDETGAINDDHLTFANVFVNGNYPYFINNIVPVFSERKVVVFANKTSNFQNLPFKHVAIPVEYNAWIENYNLIDQFRKMLFSDELQSSKDGIFLFACGPLGKILAYTGWETNKNHTYLDIGSTLHPWLLSDKNIRGYYQVGNPDSTKVCVWGND
jgi:hypothetical protein